MAMGTFFGIAPTLYSHISERVPRSLRSFSRDKTRWPEVAFAYCLPGE